MHAMLVKHLQNTKKEYKNLRKQAIYDIFTKMNQIKLVFSMTWVMETLKIELGDQLLIKYCVINISFCYRKMDFNADLLQQFINVLIKTFAIRANKFAASGFEDENISNIENQLKNYPNQLLENSEKEKHINLLQTTFGVLILLICI